MEKLKQNNLAESTSELGFLEVMNENKETPAVYLNREVTLETGETVTVEGMSASKLKEALNNGADPEVITFKTPGEVYNEEIKGVVQVYNENEGPVEWPILEKGKTYKFTVKKEIPEFEDPEFIEKIEGMSETGILNSDTEGIGVFMSLSQIMINNVQYAYMPELLGQGFHGWVNMATEELVEIEDTYTFTATKLVKEAEEVNTLDLSEFTFMFTKIEEVETPKIDTIEIGKTYKFTFKETIPEFDDPDFYTEVAQRLQGNVIIDTADIEESSIGIMDFMDFFMTMYGTIEERYLYNPEISGWMSGGGEPAAVEPLTFKVEGLLSKGEATTSLELEEMGLLFSNIEEIE